MYIMNYAEQELRLINYDKDKTDKLLNILKIISNQGHTGFSINFIISAVKNKNFDTDHELLKDNYEEIKSYVLGLDDKDIEILTKLLRWHPLSALTFEDNEWNLVGGYTEENGVHQNKRLSGIFKDGKNGKPHYIEAVRCKTQNDLCFNCGLVVTKDTNRKYYLRRCQPKFKDNFPTITINVEEVEVALDNFETYTTEEELEKVRECYIIPYEKCGEV